MSVDPQQATTKDLGARHAASPDLHYTHSSTPPPNDEPGHTSRGLTIRCPHCHVAFSVSVDTQLSEIACVACGRAVRLASEPEDGRPTPALTTVAQFELLARVGMGGFGTVWRARDTQLDRLVALKIPRKELLNAEDAEQFLHEARVAAQLSHPNIVKVFEVGRDGDTVYLVSEFMEGKSLLDWCSERELDAYDVARLGVTILGALAHAHAAGVVHRDLKPQNVLMDERGEPHITDFGLAKRIAADATHSLDGRILGTPAYMSPEQARGAASAADHRADLYSLGVLLFQLLTGELPFRGNLQRLIHHVIHDDPPRPTALDPDVPVDLETICLKLLEKDPARRYQSATEVADELERFCRHEPIRARRIGAPERLWRWCRRHPTVPGLFGTLVGVMLIVSLVGWRWYRTAASQTEQALTSQALRAAGFAAESVAGNATRQLEDHYALIESLAASPRLLDPYWQLIDDPAVDAVLEQLDSAALNDERRTALRQQLLAHPAQREIQAALRQVSEERPQVFGWFVMRDDGLQVARWPVNDTVGLNYAWRTYFHGGPVDFADRAAYLASPQEHIERTHLSAAFVSQISDRWVIVISTPLRRPATHAAAGRFEGIVALMFEVGQITELPGGEESTEFAVLVDGRASSKGMILQHPLYEQLRRGRSIRLPDHLQKLRVDLDDWSPSASPDIRLHRNFHDPLADDPLGASYDQRWLAAQSPVRIHGRESGLIALVQQSYRERIGNELQRLDRQVRLLIGGSFGLALTLVIPLWTVVLRRLGDR